LTHDGGSRSSRAALGLIGPNGAGKTTLMKLITGVLKHDAAGTARRRGVTSCRSARACSAACAHLPDHATRPHLPIARQIELESTSAKVGRSLFRPLDTSLRCATRRVHLAALRLDVRPLRAGRARLREPSRRDRARTGAEAEGDGARRTDGRRPKEKSSIVLDHWRLPGNSRSDHRT